MRAYLSILVCFSVLGCAGLPPVPSRGGPSWIRAESQHFVVYSDLAESDVRNRIALLERLLDAYYALGWEAKGQLPVKLHAVLFADRSHFQVFAPADQAAFHVASPFLEPLVVMSDDTRFEQWQTLKHELTHYIAHQSIPFQPLWLAEGLATYFETAYFDRDDRFVIGEVPTQYVGHLRMRHLLRARELFTAEGRTASVELYATSWVLVHYLMSNRGDAFATYQDLIADAHPHDVAWSKAFPDLSPEAVDAAIERYLSTAEIVKFARLVTVPKAVEPRISTLSSADVYALRAQLYTHCVGCGEPEGKSARENVDAALRLEPNHLRAGFLRSRQLPEDQGVRAAESLVKAHPAEPLAWVALGISELASSKRCRPELPTRLHALGGASAMSTMVAAACLAEAGEKREALELADRAVRRKPPDAALLTLYVAVLSATGECETLRSLLPRWSQSVHANVSSAALEENARCGMQ